MGGEAGSQTWVPVGGGLAGDLVRQCDWSATGLGPIEAWPVSLRCLVQTMLQSRHPMFLFWGPDLIQLYNDAYVPSFGRGKHPAAMGQRARECWGEIWEIIHPQIVSALSQGTPTWHEHALVPIHRNGRLEEVYWTYGYSPAYADDGTIGGVLVMCTETTSGVLATRRLQLSAALANRLAVVEDTAQLWSSALACFAEQPLDIPLAAVFDKSGACTTDPRLPDVHLRAVQALATTIPHVDLPIELSLSEPVTIAMWPEGVQSLFVTPLADGGRLVFGLTPRVPFDDAYRRFLLQVVAGIETSQSRVQALRTRVRVESERRNLLMQAPVAAALLTGPELRYELANPNYVEMVGREVVGKTYRDVFPEGGGTPMLEVAQRAYRDGEALSVEEMSVSLDNAASGVAEDHYFKFSVQPIRESDAQVTGLMLVAVDITESVQARHAQAQAHVDLQASFEERADLANRLEVANRAKDDFLAILGHELRNPLAPIVTALELLRMKSGTLQTDEHQLMERQVAHLIRLVDDLLDVARIARGKIQIRREQADLRMIVIRAIEMADPLLEQRQHRLSIDVPDAVPWVGDPTRLAQVLANLLTNAARYTPPAGEIGVTVRVLDQQIRIRVTDNGNGIATEQLEVIFNRFTQGARSIDRAAGGLGLGLTLAKSLVELHGGTITAASAGVGLGSTFEVRLPQEQVKLSAVVPLHAPQIHSARVLVVDDNLDAADMLGTLLSARGHVVRVAYDGPSALEALKSFEADVAVLDIGLPLMDGYELARRILATRGTQIGLIALTGYGQKDDRERSHAVGFQAHLVKPVSFEKLSTAIAACRPEATPPSGR